MSLARYELGPLALLRSGLADIFCDESGGTDAKSAAFVTAAVGITAADAQRLVKRFRKATRVTGEIKGSRLTQDHRTVFFDILSQHAESACAAIVSSRTESLGRWAIGATHEMDLYSHMLGEACAMLPLARTGQVAVTLDGGRYKKSRDHSIRRQILPAIDHPRIRIGFADSAAVPGLQIADVLANTIFHAYRSPAEVAHLIEPLAESGRLVVRDAQLPRLRPNWLRAP